MMTEPSTVGCPYCGSERVRRSSKQSRRRPVAIYRCSSCKRHFEIAAQNSNNAFKKLKIPGLFAIGIAAIAIALGAIWLTSTSDTEGKAKDEAFIPGELDPKLPPPVAGSDKASQFARGRYFWLRGKYSEAFPWLKSAADQGHAEARYYLGLAYLGGRGTIQNYHLAFEQIEASARQNFLNAQDQLGLMHRDGLGTTVSREQAYLWLNVAASRGHETAPYDRDKLALSMSADEIARAQDGSLREIANVGGTARIPPLTKTVPESMKNISRENKHE